MANPKSFLNESLDNWRDVRMGIVDEVKNIPASKFDFRPTPEVRSVHELVVHILEVSMMMTGELTRSDTNFKRLPWPKLLAKYAGQAYKAKTKQDLVKLLRSQIDSAVEMFERCGDLHMMQHMENFDGSLWTRMQWLHHGIAQEMYHRGQLCTYERLMGRVPALTQKIHGG